MALEIGFNQKNVILTDTSVDASVPNNNKALLVYYLKCMCNVMQLEVTDYIIQRLEDYKKYHLLTKDEEKELIRLCTVVSPDNLEGKCIFHPEEPCGGGSSNLLYKVD